MWEQIHGIHGRKVEGSQQIMRGNMPSELVHKRVHALTNWILIKRKDIIRPGVQFSLNLKFLD